jgi:uncharacterized protein YciI
MYWLIYPAGRLPQSSAFHARARRRKSLLVGARNPNAMPQFIYRIQPTRLRMLADGPTERESEVIGQHFGYLEELTAAGVVLMAGRTLTADERAFGIVVFVAESEASAQELVANDPAVKHGVMRAELFPYRVALWSSTGPEGKANGA